MKEIALYTLDIAQNSITAQAKCLDITLTEDEAAIVLTIADDGTGMSPELLARVSDPFTTTRTTRKVGMGLPLLRLAAEQTGGTLAVESREGVGTTVTAVFHAGHIDCPPLGDLAATVALLAQGLSGETELTYMHKGPQGAFTFDTAQVRAILGPEVPLSLPEVAQWMEGYVAEGEAGLRPEAPPERGTRPDTVREGTT